MMFQSSFMSTLAVAQFKFRLFFEVISFRFFSICRIPINRP